MLHDLVVAGVFESRQTQQSGVVPQAQCRLPLGEGLFGLPHQAGDFDDGAVAPIRNGLRGVFQHQTVQTGLPDGELGCVDPNRQSTGAGIQVIAAERRLAAFVELSLRIQGQGMCGNNGALAEHRQHAFGKIGPVQRHGHVYPSFCSRFSGKSAPFLFFGGR